MLFGLATAAKAQRPGESSSQGTHGLTLTIKKSPPSDDVDENTFQQSHLKACLDRHPLFACKPLIVTLKNEGDETSCIGLRPARVEFSMRHLIYGTRLGGWHSFRPGNDFVCTANVMLVQRIGPGQSYEGRLTLADLNLRFNAGVSYGLRVRWDITGCIAAQRDGPQEDDPARAQCLGDAKPQHRFVSLQSNEIGLESDPVRAVNDSELPIP